MRVSLLRDDVLTPRALAVVRGAGLGDLLRRSGTTVGVPARHGLAVRLTDDAALRELNLTFAATDHATDVLAFPGDGDHVGDIAISVERAMAQREAAPEAELRLLAIHGLLHCLGHDHAEPEQARKMTELTRILLPGEDIPDLVAH